MVQRSALLPTTALAAVLLAAVPATAADRASESPRQLLKEIQRDLADVDSYHVAATIHDHDGSTERLSIDVVSSDGSIRLTGAEPGGGRFSLRVVGKRSYLRANAAYWRSTSARADRAVISKLANRWIIMPAASTRQLASLYQRFLPQTLASCVGQGVGTLVKAGTGMIDGHRAVIIRDKGDKPGTSPGRLWIAASGPALPLRERDTGPERPGGKVNAKCGQDGKGDTTSSGEIRFSRYNTVKPITAPRHATALADLGRSGTTNT
jgi:hypothetical protein